MVVVSALINPCAFHNCCNIESVDKHYKVYVNYNVQWVNTMEPGSGGRTIGSSLFCYLWQNCSVFHNGLGKAEQGGQEGCLPPPPHPPQLYPVIFLHTNIIIIVTFPPKFWQPSLLLWVGSS